MGRYEIARGERPGQADSSSSGPRVYMGPPLPPVLPLTQEEDEGIPLPPGNHSIRVVWAETLNREEVNHLREELEMAQRDPNYIVVTNYGVNYTVIPGTDSTGNT